MQSKNNLRSVQPIETTGSATVEYPEAYYGPPPGIRIKAGDRFTLADGTRVIVGAYNGTSEAVLRGWSIAWKSGEQMDAFPEGRDNMLDDLASHLDPDAAELFGLKEQGHVSHDRRVLADMNEEGRRQTADTLFLVLDDDEEAKACLVFEGVEAKDASGNTEPDGWVAPDGADVDPDVRNAPQTSGPIL